MAVLILYNRVIKRTAMTKKKREKKRKNWRNFPNKNIKVYFNRAGQILSDAQKKSETTE